FPKAVTRIGDDGNEWNASGEIQLLQHAREDMLRQSMHTHDDMRAPALKQFDDVSDAAFIKKPTRLGPDVIHAPVEILHPVLAIAQYPVVQAHELRAQMI